MQRRAQVREAERCEQSARVARELQGLENERVALEAKANADRTRIAKRRYELEHGVDRTNMEAALVKAQQDVQKLTAQLAQLPPLPTN